jgi:hypothetical protein
MKKMTDWNESLNKQLFNYFIETTVIPIRSLSATVVGNGRRKSRLKCQNLNSFHPRLLAGMNAECRPSNVRIDRKKKAAQSKSSL